MRELARRHDRPVLRIGTERGRSGCGTRRRPAAWPGGPPGRAARAGARCHGTRSSPGAAQFHVHTRYSASGTPRSAAAAGGGPTGRLVVGVAVVAPGRRAPGRRRRAAGRACRRARPRGAATARRAGPSRSTGQPGSPSCASARSDSCARHRGQGGGRDACDPGCDASPSVTATTRTGQPRSWSTRSVPPTPSTSSSGWGATTTTAARPPARPGGPGHTMSGGACASSQADQRASGVPASTSITGAASRSSRSAVSAPSRARSASAWDWRRYTVRSATRRAWSGSRQSGVAPVARPVRASTSSHPASTVARTRRARRSTRSRSS